MTDDELVADLVRKSQQLNPDGCCSTDTWRGHLCQYHQGYEDGADAVLVALARVIALGRAVETYGPARQVRHDAVRYDIAWNECLDAIFAAAGVTREGTE